MILFIALAGTFGVEFQSGNGDKTFKFSGRNWVVRASGEGGPGPNLWDDDNAWVSVGLAPLRRSL